jgi:acetoacetyl-CoA synthetase
VPDEIVPVAAIPHTRTGKKLEVPVKRLIQGWPLAEAVDTTSVDDPAALSFFEEFARRRQPAG